MQSNSFQFVKPVAQAAFVAALSVAGAASHAALTVYSTQIAFNAAVNNIGVDSFAGLTTGSPVTGPLTRSAGSHGYTATTSVNDFFVVGTAANPWLSTSSASAVVTIGGFTGGPVAGIGGNFFGSDIDGLFSAGNVTLTATDTLGATSTQTITGATTTSFLGFVSSAAITSLTITAAQPTTGALWPTMDNLTLAAAVPEPESYALMLAGIGTVAALARRRR